MAGKRKPFFKPILHSMTTSNQTAFRPGGQSVNELTQGLIHCDPSRGYTLYRNIQQRREYLQIEIIIEKRTILFKIPSIFDIAV